MKKKLNLDSIDEKENMLVPPLPPPYISPSEHKKTTVGASGGDTRRNKQSDLAGSSSEYRPHQ
jgi:hypothetical protein